MLRQQQITNTVGSSLVSQTPQARRLLYVDGPSDPPADDGVPCRTLRSDGPNVEYVLPTAFNQLPFTAMVTYNSAMH